MGYVGSSIAGNLHGGGGLFEWMWSLGPYKGGWKIWQASKAQRSMIALLPLHKRFGWLLKPDGITPIDDAARMALMRSRFNTDPNLLNPLSQTAMQNAANTALAQAQPGSRYHGIVSESIEQARLINRLMGQTQRLLRAEEAARNANVITQAGMDPNRGYLRNRRGTPIRTRGGGFIQVGRPR
jgi:hypothetical protein